MAMTIFKLIKPRIVSRRFLIRRISSYKLSERDVEEIQIPVTWGHISGKWWGDKNEPPVVAVHGWQDNANSFDKLIPLLNLPSVLAIDLPGHGLSSHFPEGKWWGSRDKQPILCLHGWQDNANTFDTLIPQLSSEFSYLAIDLPGHGLSSHIPKGIFYNTHVSLTTIRKIQDHFKWKKLSFIGHSLGGILSFLYSSIFSNDVNFFVAIDGIKPTYISSHDEIKNGSETVDKLLKYDSLDISTAIKYTENDLIKLWLERTKNSITEKSCKILIQRGASKKNGLFTLRRDPKLKKTFLAEYRKKQTFQMAENISCSVLYIKAMDWPHLENEQDVIDVVQIIKKKAKYFEEHKLPGSHHLHLNNPEVVAPVINAFIKSIPAE